MTEQIPSAVEDSELQLKAPKKTLLLILDFLKNVPGWNIHLCLIYGTNNHLIAWCKIDPMPVSNKKINCFGYVLFSFNSCLHRPMELYCTMQINICCLWWLCDYKFKTFLGSIAVWWTPTAVYIVAVIGSAGHASVKIVTVWSECVYSKWYSSCLIVAIYTCIFTEYFYFQHTESYRRLVWITFRDLTYYWLN